MGLLRFSLALLLCPQIHAGELDSERVWNGKSGKTFRGTLHSVTGDGSAVDILDAQGKLYRVAIANLNDADRKLIETWGEPDPGKKDPLAPGDLAAFKTLPELDRKKLPIINQGELGQKASDCVPSSFCNFLLWWDQEKMLEIPKRGDFDSKAEWIHSKMARYCGTRNTAGTNGTDAREGFTNYFEKEIGDLATLRIHEDHDVRPENLARYTTGANATMLEMTTVQSNGSEGGHWVALVSAEPGGRVVFNTWGAQFEGLIRVFKPSEKPVTLGTQTVPSTTYEIVLTNRDKLPQWVNNSGTRFVLDPSKWDGIIVVRPYIFSEKGKKSAPPEEPLFAAPSDPKR